MEPHAVTIHLEEEMLQIGGVLKMSSVMEFLQLSEQALKEFQGKQLTLDLQNLGETDSSGIAAIHLLQQHLADRNIQIRVLSNRKDLSFPSNAGSAENENPHHEVGKPGFFERVGSSTWYLFREYITSFISLAADITYWSVAGIFRKRSHRKGEVVNQAVLMGVNAAFIVSIMTFVIGLVLALQSAEQLRTFGANIYIVDLTVIAMMSEMGPLITAIIVAGRSGSSIAAEISTMKVTSETDALKTMGIDPVRFLVVPKMYAGLLTMPLLTIIADIMGILGGLVIATGSLDISPVVFLNRMEESLYLRDILFGVIKSIVFSYLIILTGSYFGFRAEKGAAGVGRVTTRAVVVSISMVIVADSIMGLLFY